MTAPPQSPDLLVRTSTPGDLEFVLSQHREHFPDNVFGRLGTGFLRRYYESFQASPHATALVATRQGRPMAYLVGIEDTGAHRAWLRRHRGLGLGASAAWGLARRPRTAVRILRARLARRAATRTAGADRQAPAAEHRPVQRVAVLSHVAVSSTEQAAGLGHRLVGRFVDGCTVAGATRIAVATSEDNVAAARLYERNGWVLEARRTTFDGRAIRIYDKTLVPREHEGETT